MISLLGYYNIIIRYNDIIYYQYYTGCWFGTCFPYIGNVIIQTDFHVFQRVGIPPTSIILYGIYVYMYVYIVP